MIFILFLVSIANMARAVTIYVDNTLDSDITDGSYDIEDRDNSGSDGDAYKTAQGAADVSAPGDTIYFRAGTYYETGTVASVPVLHIATSGTLANPITYENYNDEVVIFNALYPGTGKQKYEAVALGVKPSPGTGVSNIVLKGLIFEHASYRGLAIFGPTEQSEGDYTENITVDHCIARYNYGGSAGWGIFSSGVVVNVNIQYCEAYDNAVTGIELCRMDKDWHQTEPADAMTGPRNCIIQHCLCYDNEDPDDPGDTDGLGLSAAYQSTIADCVLYNNSDDGLDVYMCIECTVENNISFNHVGGDSGLGNGTGIKVSAGGGGRHTVSGNISVLNKGHGIEGSDPSGIYLDSGAGYWPSLFYNNMVYDNGGTGINIGYSKYVLDYGGWPKSLIYNNIMVENGSDDDFKTVSDGSCFTSDYNFISQGGVLTALQNVSNDSHSITGSPGLHDIDFVPDTTFTGGWTIEQKLAHIRDQFSAAYDPEETVIDAGVVIDGYHNPTSGEGELEDWYGEAPDIGAYEDEEGGEPPVTKYLMARSEP